MNAHSKKFSQPDASSVMTLWRSFIAANIVSIGLMVLLLI